jgi:surface protein
MSYMFQNATSFNQNLAYWNVENVTDFGQMFHGSGLSGLDTTVLYSLNKDSRPDERRVIWQKLWLQ